MLTQSTPTTPFVRTGALRPRPRHDLSLRVFASTYNAGSAGKTAEGLGPLDAWIPTGYDLYVIVRTQIRTRHGMKVEP